MLEATDPLPLAALATRLRNRLLFALGAGGGTVSQLSTRLGTNKGNVAHHLGVLESGRVGARGRAPVRCAGAPSSTSAGGAPLRTPGGGRAGHTAALLQTVAEEVDASPGETLLQPPPHADDAVSRRPPWPPTSNGWSPSCRRGRASDPLHSVLVGLYRVRWRSAP